MGWCASVGRFLLVTINMLFMMIGLGLIALGALVHQNFKLIINYLKLSSTFDDIKQDIETTFGQDVDIDDGELYQVFKTLSTIVICIGLLLFLLALGGLIGSCCRVKKLLLIYGFSISGFLVLTFILVFVVFGANADTVKSGMRRPLEEMLEMYKGSNGTNAESWAWNFIMRKYSCCGISDYTDFQQAHNWWGRNTHLTPYACCVKFPTNWVEAATCAGSSSTASVTTIKNNNYYDKGCVDAIWDSIFKSNAAYFIGGLFLLFILLMTVALFSFVLYCNKDDDDAKRKSKNAVYPGYPVKANRSMNPVVSTRKKKGQF